MGTNLNKVMVKREPDKFISDLVKVIQ